VRLASPIGSAAGGSVNLSTSLRCEASGTSQICVGFQRQPRWDNHL
jgi:hypothetical protein